MAIRQAGHGKPGSEQGLGVDVGAQAGEGTLLRGETELSAQGAGGALSDALSAGPKPLKPLPHGIIDYAMAGTLMAAPWLFGFSRNRKATTNAVVSGAAVLGLSLMTRYPLGAMKTIPFTAHGVVETLAAFATAAAPWTLGFSHDRSAKLTHVLSGLATLGVVAMTDYRAADQPGGADTPSLEEVTSALSSLGEMLPQGLTDAVTDAISGGQADGQAGETSSMAAGAGGGA